MSNPVCIVMVKSPRVGTVKTRLAPPLSEASAATLAACFAKDVVENVRQVVDKVLVSYAPRDGRDELEILLNSDTLLWHEQRGADLGERLRGAMDYAVSFGYGPVIAVGTDSPTLPLSHIKTAVHALSADKADIALGPAEDGGYYLIGLRQFAPGLFQEVAWSTAETYQQTVRNVLRLRLRLLELPRWYDIDTFPDLLRLREELRATAGARERVPATYAWLQAHESHLFVSR